MLNDVTLNYINFINFYIQNIFSSKLNYNKVEWMIIMK